MKTKQGADFDDVMLRQRAYQVKDIGLCAFLLSLAAWQRGLKVTFHYEVTDKCPRFAHSAVQGFRGELFSIESERQLLFFRRTLCERVTSTLSRFCDDKAATKQCLVNAGVDVPRGVVLHDHDLADKKAISGFLQRSDAGQRFVLKPVGGTLAQGVHRQLSAAEVWKQWEKVPSEPYLLEEYIPGPNYRVIVVGGRFVAAWMNRVPQVVGNGRDDLNTLAAKARARSAHLTHPILTLEKLVLSSAVLDYLDRRGLTARSVPEDGETVVLWPEPDDDCGAEVVDVTATVPDAVVRLAVMAMKVLDLPVGGVDLIFDEQQDRVVVLEVNQMPMIRAMTFPHDGQGQHNRVAEAIVDHYFPESRVQPHLVNASFDFMQVRQVLASGLVAAVSLPVCGVDWQVRRLRFPGKADSDAVLDRVRQAMHHTGIYAHWLFCETGDLLVEALGPVRQLSRFCDLCT